MYKLYSIDKYKGKTQKFINECFNEYTLDDLLIKLKYDNNYHMRILSNSTYIFFGDIDGYDNTFNKFSELLINFMRVYYNIELSLNNIYYTINKSKKGSFHYSIPKIYASCTKIQEIHKNFYEINKNEFIYKINEHANLVYFIY